MDRKMAIFIVLGLVLVGCAPRTTDRDLSTVNFRTGSQGLDMRYAQNLPPPRLYDDQEFDVMIEVYNRGATDISGGNSKVFLSGFDGSIISGVRATTTAFVGDYGATLEGLEGKSQLNPTGDFETIEFKGQIRDLESRNIDVYSPTLLATACYRYETIANPTVCIDGDPFSTASKQKICIPGTVGTGSQGAPIAVPSVEVDARPRTTQFRINIQNVGGGTVFKDGFQFLSRCDPYDRDGLSYRDVDYVTLQQVRVGQKDITGSCKPIDDRGNIRLPDGNGFIICTMRDITDPVYTTPLRIVLRYGYRSSISQRVEIVATPQ